MAPKSSILSLSLCFLVLFRSCSANDQYPRQRQQQNECQIQNLNPQEPIRRIQHEAGVSEVWDQNNEQLNCAGVAATRHILEPRGLLLPSFNNAPMLVYVAQGRGILGTMIPGCPETYQSFQQSVEGRQGQQRSRDQHQKIQHFRQGDIIALPAGVAHWCYNDANNQLVLMVVHDTSNNDNQLDRNLRRFFLAGNPQEKQAASLRGQEQSGKNIFQGFDVETLAEAFGVSRETARKLQNEDDRRGNIVKVENGLRVVRPQSQQQEEVEEEEEERGYKRTNGLEETLCTMRLRENLHDPERADLYSARGGRISTLNSQNLPILRNIQLSAERGVLYRNAMVAPHWNINAHSVVYITKGNGRVQIVGNSNTPAFDGQVREGQLLIIPQNFAVVKQAGNQGLEWISVKTNDLAKTSPLAGKTSVLRGMPEEVLMNAYKISRDEAKTLKYNREEVAILSPRSTSRAAAAAAWSVVESLL